MRFKHDCKNCKPLGEFEEFDLYFCLQTGTMPTVLVRYGNDGPEYTSGLGFTLPAMREAEKRATDAGLLEGKKS